MKLLCMMPVRNEDWIIGLSIRAALMWVDELVVLDHASTDRTPEILSELSEETGRLTILTDSDPTWKEMAHRQRLLDTARRRGATHCAIVDADEVLTGNLLPTIRNEVSTLRAGGYLQCFLPACTGAIDRFREDGSVWSRGFATLAFADREDLCWQTKHDGYDFHHREPYFASCERRLKRSAGGLMHLQFVYRRRLIAKHALYKMTEVLRWPGRQPVSYVDELYSMAPDWEGMVTSQTPPQWWAPYQDLLPHLDLTHEPWQEAECKRLMLAHGRERFQGLDLFGVV